MSVAGPILLCTLAASLPSTPPDAGTFREVVASAFLLPGGITDPAGRTGFLTNPEGGLSAIDLRNGKILWETTAGRRPIVTTGERLYASVPAGPGQLRVVALDILRQGAVIFESKNVAIPLSPSNVSKTVRWIPIKNHIRVTWETEGDAAPEGGALVDLRTGQLHPLTDELPGPAKEPVDLAKFRVRWQGFVGRFYKVLVLDESTGTQQLVLRSWDVASGGAQPARELLRGKRLVVRASMNDQQLFLRDAVPCPDEKADEHGQHAWSIFDISSGERLARLPYEPGTQAVAIFGPRAYCLVAGSLPASLSGPFVNPRVLKAVDLKTGKTLWERPAEGKWLVPVGT
jgi:hypothetical protein